MPLAELERRLTQGLFYGQLEVGVKPDIAWEHLMDIYQQIGQLTNSKYRRRQMKKKYGFPRVCKSIDPHKHDINQALVGSYTRN